MGERLSTLFTIVLLAALAGLTYWLDRVVQEITPTREKPPLHEPDYIAEKLLTTRMGLDGRVRDSLQATTLTHYPDDDRTELIAPRFVSYAGAAPMTITASQGEITSNGGNVYFNGDVVVKRAAVTSKRTSDGNGGDHNGEVTLTTDYLHFLPDDNIARTNRPVTLQDNQLSVRAGGMELNGETRVFKLSGGVKGAYNAGAASSAAGKAR